MLKLACLITGSVALGGALGSCAVDDAPKRTCRAAERHSAPTEVPNAILRSRLAEWGLPSATNLVTAHGYISSVNYERRIPNWVLERIDVSTRNISGATSEAPPATREKSKFYADERVPEMFRQTNSDYTRRGLSRGHLAAAQLHKQSQEEMNETFNLSANIVPQDMTMNACDWYRLESMTKRLAKSFDGGLWVVSGPMFVPMIDPNTGRRMVSYEVVGTHDVAVPTHLFKCLLGVKDSRTFSACFVMPNEPIPEERPLVSYQVAISYVERVTGLEIFPVAFRGRSLASSPVLTAASSSTAEGSGNWGSMFLRTAPPADLCSKFTCEGSYAAFSKSYRQIGKLRSATSAAEVKAMYILLYQEGNIDAAVEKELKAKLQEFGAGWEEPPKKTTS